MPSAANVKVDKQVAPENALADSSTPLRQVITLVEHKIRNLEKRKSKLESYRDLQNAGKELNADQKTAVAKYNEVMHTLEFARDIYKQFHGIASVSEKEAKKQAKKEAAAKNQAELARLREILLVQDALYQMGQENVRDDFLHGRNGAAQLTETDLKLLDDLYPAVTPKHEAGNPTAFMNEVQTAAEHLLAVVDGKPKEVFGGSYSQVKEILGKIHESGYFDQEQVFEGFPEGEQVVEIAAAEVVQVNHDAVQPEASQPLPQMEMLAVDPLPPQMLQPPPPPEQAPIEQALTPEQQLFYQQQQQQSQVPQQQTPRPITEMLGSGSFFFLQESEIDTPPEQIPSQTFTNQSFVGGPPPPIPLPPLFQAPMPPQSIPATGNNGIEEAHKEEVHKPQNTNGGGNRPPKPNSNNQSYYQNNNGYTNRPRQNRNGARPMNRHN